MIRVFSEEECDEIAERYKKVPYAETKYIVRAQNIVIDYLKSNNLTLTRDHLFKDMIHNVSTKEAKSWHYDEVTLINFIVILQGEGTHVSFSNDSVIQTSKGYGYIVIGKEGYKFLGLDPVLHCAPSSDENRLLFKLMLRGDINIDECIVGPSVCAYNSSLYKERAANMCGFKSSMV